MPALPAVPAVIKTAIRQTLVADVDVLNILYWSYTGGPATSSDIATFAENTLGSWADTIIPMTSTDFEVTEVTATDLTSDTSPEATYSSTVAGGATPAALPAGTALVISHEISRRYRGGHPRTYIAGLTEEKLTNPQQWTSAFLATAATQWGSFITQQKTAGSAGAVTITNLVNVSYYKGFTNVLYPSGRYRAVPAVRPVPVVDVINSAVMRPKIGSQRRRNQYSGA